MGTSVDGRKGARSRRRIRLPRWAVWTVLGLAAVLFLWLFWPFWELSGQFADQPLRQPSRLYGRPTVLSLEDLASPQALAKELEELGYRKARGDGPLVPGRYRAAADRLVVHLRNFPTPSGRRGGGVLEVRFSGRRITRLRLAGEEIASASFEPPLLTSYYGPDLKERRPVLVDEVPEDLIHAILAAEDDEFFRHSGISFSGILRAAWVNLTGRRIEQGGSTLTQQLVKNLYLSPERTWLRKLREAILAVLLEVRYDKRSILQAYLNEIYLGKSGPANLMGVGAAARVYFSKEVGQLTLAESALLAGMIRAPGHYSPLQHPERALARRNWVLDRLGELGWVPVERLEEARRQPLELAPDPVVARRAPYFAEAMATEARERFGIPTLGDGGYVLLSTLDLGDQEEAKKALRWGLQALEKGWQKGHKGEGPLQGAVVSLDPRDGGILAYVGGRDFRQSQFDRAGQARRQAGSAFKPVVYAAAFEAGVASPATWIEDAPLTVTLAGRTWNPRNDDNAFQGWITVRTALEESRNVPTVRLALQVGLPRIVELAREMGVSAQLEPVPALALGAFEVTPVEMATVYGTLAGQGRRPPVHGLVAAFDRHGRSLAAPPLPEPREVLSPQSAYLVTSLLEGVLDRGTGAGARRQGLTDRLAGKTGTTNGRRDSWFAGYAPNRVTVVWVGYDDNSPTHLSGARAALPVWARFTQAVRPAAGYPVFSQPPGIFTAVIDPETGELATDACPEVLTEVFLQGQIPTRICHRHGGWFAEPLPQPQEVEIEEGHPFRRWLRRVFGGPPEER